MAMNLGLEFLTESSTSNVLSYEYLDAVFEYNVACEELTIVFDQFDNLLRAAENLQAVSDVIKEQGVTPALEALVGENFDNGLSAETVDASIESVGEKIKNFLVSVWQAIKTFFIKLFNSADGIVKRLDSWIENSKSAQEADFSTRPFKGFALGQSMNAFKTYITKINKLDEGELASFEGGKSFDLQEMTLTFAQAKIYAKDLRDGFVSLKGKKEALLKTVDEKLKAASAVEDEKAKESQIKEAKDTKAVVNKVFKGAFSTAAGFLAANSLKGKKEEASDEQSDDNNNPRLPNNN